MLVVISKIISTPEIVDYEYYVKKFQKSANRVDKKMLNKKHIEIYVGIYRDSVVLKLYKREWTNDKTDPINAKSRIFFSIWVSDKTIKQNKVYYNIHAFKLRELKGYSIKSRDFTNEFRRGFKAFERDWKNVSVKFGPLTLMEGWHYFTNENLESIVEKLADNFLLIENLIESTLEKFESTNLG